MNDFTDFMRSSETVLADLVVRVNAMENVLTQLAGVSMEPDLSKPPVVVVEPVQPRVEVIDNASN